MRTFHIARTPDDWRTLTGETVRFHTYSEGGEPGDHVGTLDRVGDDGTVWGGFGAVRVDLLTVVEVLDQT